MMRLSFSSILILLTFLSGTVDADTRISVDVAGGIGIPIAPQRIATGWEGGDALEARIRHHTYPGIHLLVMAGRYRFFLLPGRNYGGLNITNLKNIVRTEGGTLEVQSLGGGILVTPRLERWIDYYLLLSMSWDRVLQHSVTFFTPTSRQIVKSPHPGPHLGVAFGVGLVVRRWKMLVPFIEVADHFVNVAPPGGEEGALQFPTVKIGITTRIR
jgi:hypothetical protein